METKPEKPWPDFPLTPHNSGSWVKKIKGKLHYFGPWRDPDGAYQKYLREIDFLMVGEVVPPRVPVMTSAVGIRLADGLNMFLDSAKKRERIGELSKRSWQDYAATAKRLLDTLGRLTPIQNLLPSDWQRHRQTLSKRYGPKTLSTEITRIRVMMNWLVQNRHIDREPHYGTEFRMPTRLQVRKSRAAGNRLWFTADEIRRIAAVADVHLRAMIYLGINCGYGNHDCAQLEQRWVDLDAGWIQFARPKTGIDRRCPLWPETVQALRDSFEARPQFKTKQFFVTIFGNPWSDPNSADCLITKKFKSVSAETSCYVERRGFYGLRRTFETIGGESTDQVAVDHIMGHVDNSMAGVYRQHISDDRLIRVVETIRQWLLPGPWRQG